MGIEGIHVVVQLLLFAAVAYGVYLALQMFADAKSDIVDLEAQLGAQTFEDLSAGLPRRTVTLIRNGAALSAFLLFLVLGNLFVALLAAGAAYVIPTVIFQRNREKRTRKIETQLVEALELLGNSLRSGLTIQQATALVVQEFPPPISQEFSVVLSETRLGVEFTDALANMARRLGSNVVQILASGVAVTKRCGGDLTVIFQNIAQVIRDQAQIEGKLYAVTAQGRFQGLVLGLMPFILIGVLYFVDPAHVQTLFGYRMGMYAVAVVVAMVVGAQLWIKKLLEIDV